MIYLFVYAQKRSNIVIIVISGNINIAYTVAESAILTTDESNFKFNNQLFDNKRQPNSVKGINIDLEFRQLYMLRLPLPMEVMSMNIHFRKHPN